MKAKRSISMLLLLVTFVGCEDLPQEHHRHDRDDTPTISDDHDHPPVIASARHPRLIISEAELLRVKQLASTDPVERDWFRQTVERNEKFLTVPPIAPVRGSILHEARESSQRITNLAAMYRLTGDKRYSQRGITELLAAARLPDWSPDDFLATAEMTCGESLGYDWLFDQLTPAQRKTIVDAIVQKGLTPALDAYQSNQGWTTARHNWNLVCNGGEIVGALAVMDEEPKIAKRVLADAKESVRFGFSCFVPDGAWEEGPTYWNYATRYMTYAMASLQTSQNTDWGWSKSAGVSNTGLFRMFVVGPTRLPFNFADSEAEIGNSAQLMYLSKVFDRPLYAAYEQHESANDPGIFDLLWYQPVDMTLLDHIPRDAMFREAFIAAMRGSWTDPNATYVACKGGSNQAHHGHLDLGTFVLDAQGQRWGMALGADDYNLPEYFGDKRFSYYRCSTRGQNTITLNNENQNANAVAPIVGFKSGPHESHVVFDLSNAWQINARKAERGFMMLDRRDVLVQDEFDLPAATDVRWNFHTTAAIELNGRTAVLRQGGKTLTARILQPAEARFDAINGNPPPPQGQIAGMKNLTIHLPGSRGKIRIIVLFTPGEGNSPLPKVSPLSEWAP